MHNSAKFPLPHVVQEKNAGSGLKKFLCMHISALVFTQWKRKKHVKRLKKRLFVRINFHVLEPGAPLMLWEI